MRAPARRRLSVVTLILALSACSSAPDQPAQPSDSPAASSTPTGPAPAPTATPSRRARTVQIAVAGDIHFEGVLQDRLQDAATALAPAAQALARADVAIVNLESSVGTGGRPEPGKRFTFSAGPAAFAALSAAGVDVASMANNHALDFGRGRLPSTFAAARAAAAADPPLSVVGIGRDEDQAFQPALIDLDGTVVATVAASVADQDPTADPTGHWAATIDRPGIADALDPARLLEEVRRVAEVADVVVVYLHWGIQGERCASGDQRRLADILVRAGADLVVGSHAHVLQGDGRLGRGYVAYGLGNYAWYSPGSEESSWTGVLTLGVQPPRAPAGRARVVHTRWHPARIGSDGLPHPLDGSAAADFRADRRALRTCADLTR